MSYSNHKQCPRCGSRSFETLKTYSHCIECLYIEDDHYDFETVYHQAVRIEKTFKPAKVIEFPKRIKKQKGEAS